MNTEKIEQLLSKYFEGETSLKEEEVLRDFFRNESVPDKLQSYREQFLYASEITEIEPDEKFDPFAGIEKDIVDARPAQAAKMNSRLLWTLRVAAGLILLLTGFSAGLLVNQQEDVSNIQVAAIQDEIQQMKQVLVYGSEGKLTASERITAVKFTGSVSGGRTGLDREITDILIYTLNNDTNINVREAAAEALFRFREEPKIRKALAESLSRQRDPLMQITLINMIVEIKETSAVNEMQKLLMDSDTREVVKTRLESGIAELKT
ncbi:MAG: HEAT repeat domain-containing protein [Candidatus Halalkalibacterium sp. M3_1C_030]